MTTAIQIQALLRFLSQDAKVPMVKAMSSIKALQSASLTTPALIAEAKLDALEPIFNDIKISKQVHNAAKRSQKAKANPGSSKTPKRKLERSSTFEVKEATSAEASLTLPEPVLDEELIKSVVLITNRAPLVLAFGLVLVKYTMPEQPLSSRLSLAQAAVSINSRSKAVSLGLEQGQSAEEEGWGQGQARVQVMGRSIRVMKRYGWKEVDTSTEQAEASQNEPEPPAYWALDLEALKKSTDPAANDGTGVGLGSNLPIYTPQSARSYLMRAFSTRKTQSETLPKSKKVPNQGEENVALLLGALELLIQSWASTLKADELDRRAWQWYIQTRPDVANGVQGWGAKGELRLADILKLRRET